MSNKMLPTVAKKKPPAAGMGRKKGVPNNTTRDVRAAIAAIAEKKAGEVEQWLSLVAADDPAKALDLYLRMIEYHIPKLARSEVTGEGGGPLKVEARLEVVLNGPHAP